MTDQPELEFHSVMVAMDETGEKFRATVKELHEAGWMVQPHSPPVAVYHLFRPIKAEDKPLTMKVQIDESKIEIVKANVS